LSSNFQTLEIKYNIRDWLPTTKKEVQERGWSELDVILFTGDAYIDHPSFGSAVIGRMLEAEGLKVAIVPQPNWRDDLRDFRKLGKPRLFFGVTSGSMDSMVNHYTVNKRLRSDDAFTPGGVAGFRPDRAVTVYSKILKSIFPETPIVIGGIEASLRRITHYDYWEDKLLPSILSGSGADLLVYGMGEQPLKELIRLLLKGVPFNSINTIPQTAFILEDINSPPAIKDWKDIQLFSHEECLTDKKKQAKNFITIEEESNKWQSGRQFQKIGNQTVIINPPFPRMSENEIDASFDLPYTRLPHPKYYKKENIPAFEMIKFSINTHRGCFGGCSFCTISAHQGKFVVSRSRKSIIKEADRITKMADFKGYISDLGGPSANMYKLKGRKEETCIQCKRPSCIFPSICVNLDTDHSSMTDIYRSVASLAGIKKVTIGSGIRYDLLLNDKASPEEKESHRIYTRELIKNHISGRLKVAPEHTSEAVLKIMRKPSFALFRTLKILFDKINKEHNLNQQLIPYFISSHPGSRDIDMAELAIDTRNMDFKLEQVQDFTPTPMTLATEIFYLGFNPYNQEKIYTARSKEEKLDQRMFFFWYKPEYKKKIENYLNKINRKDLVKSLFRR
jgi:uncharacterized radical SAM protein YgiQ